jgi:hypothetical protein
MTSARVSSRLRNGTSLVRYAWLTHRRDALWFPLASLALFVAILVVLRSPGLRFNVARGYLGFVMPLSAGVLSAYAVLDDPAIELRFATPARPGATLLGRLGAILATQALCAGAFQLSLWAFHVDLGRLGGWAGVQLVWLVPTLALAALATAGALAAAQTTVGAALVGAVWLIEVMMRSWFQTNAQSVYLFLGALEPAHPGLPMNRWVLVVVTTLLLAISWRLLHRQERFL